MANSRKTAGQIYQCHLGFRLCGSILPTEACQLPASTRVSPLGNNDRRLPCPQDYRSGPATWLRISRLSPCARRLVLTSHQGGQKQGCQISFLCKTQTAVSCLDRCARDGSNGPARPGDSRTLTRNSIVSRRMRSTGSSRRLSHHRQRSWRRGCWKSTRRSPMSMSRTCPRYCSVATYHVRVWPVLP